MFPPMTLGVADLARSSLYYQALGWQPFGRQRAGGISQGRNLVLGLYGRSALAEDAQVEDRPTGCAAITLACNCASRDEVDRLFSAATAARRAGDQDAAGSVLGWLLRICRRPDGHLGKLPTTRSGRSTSRATWSCPEGAADGKTPRSAGVFLRRRSAFIRLAGRCARRRWRGSSGLGYLLPGVGLVQRQLVEVAQAIQGIGVADPADFMLESLLTRLLVGSKRS